CAFWIALVLVPQYAVSHVANAPTPPLGKLPKAEAFSSAASNCCKSCILPWSSAVRLAPVDFLETSLQKPPSTFPMVSMDLPQRVASPMPGVAATPGKECPNPEPPNQAIWASCECVAQNPWVRVAPLPVFSKTHFTVSPFLRLMVAVWVFTASLLLVLPPVPLTNKQVPGLLGSPLPPMAVRVQPNWVNSFTV